MIPNVNGAILMKWFETLAATPQQNLFSKMRYWGNVANRHFEKARELWPPYGWTAVGGAHFDEELKAVCIESYLRGLRKGETPAEALKSAEAERTAAVTRWNTSRGNDYQTHRSLTAEQTLLETIHRTIVKASQ
jgi:hypothetical protein